MTSVITKRARSLKQRLSSRPLKAGIAVYKPLSGHSRADLIFELGDELWRVQVKWGQLSVEREVVTARLSGARCSPRAGYLSTPYREDEVDLFAIYCGDLDRSFLVPIDLASRLHMIQLRLTPTRNNQRACITWPRNTTSMGL